MILEGNNYDLDTLLVYYQDEEISASQLIEHASDNMTERYLHFISKKNLEDCEKSARIFLDWYMDEGRDIDEADLVDEVDDGMVPFEDIVPPYESWKDNPDMIKKVVYSKTAPKICFWRYNNPMSMDIEQCARDTGSSLDEVKLWWRTPDFIIDLKGEDAASREILSEEQIASIFLVEGAKYM